MKKLLIVSIVFAFVLTTSVAFGFQSHFPWHKNDSGLEVKNDNHAYIDNDVFAVSNTGANDANYNKNLGVVITGDAGSEAIAETQANYNEVDIEDCDCLPRKGELKIDNKNHANVDNTVVALSNTGFNDANNNGTTELKPTYSFHHGPTNGSSSSFGAGIVVTGNAGSSAGAFTLVNSNVFELGD